MQLMDKETEQLMTPPYTVVNEKHPLWLDVREALREVYDPEIPVNLYELGLFYRIDINDKTNDVDIKMTLTSPACPVAGEMPGMVQDELKVVDGLGKISVELVWEPAWDPTMMAETAKLHLNIF